MYYYVDTDGLVRLLDGDKMSSLSAMFIMDLVKAAGIELKVGVVQTAYANGNSTSYLTKVLVYHAYYSLIYAENPRIVYAYRREIPSS